ncbi:MAG: hypothetical protein JSW00_08925 [Thermoplasmata archaeon]|nr:MAG: hypothetical protein JSW00_08925 [Thermoplasmata archaeon]
MARVSTVFNAGLASAALPPPPGAKPVELVDESRYKAQQRIERETAGLPNDIVPAALAGAGAGWVFGPLGGLIGFAVAKHFAGKQRREAEAYADAALASERDHLKEANDALDNMAAQATNPEELADLNMRREQVQAWGAAVHDPDPAVRRNALLGLQTTAGTLKTDMDTWETQRLEADARAREQRQTHFSNYQSLDAKLTAKSQRFLGAQETWNKAQLAYERPNPQSDMALIYLTAQMIDPGAIVTDGDSKMIQATGSLTQQMAGYLNSLIDGTAGFDDDVRDGLMSVIAENYLPMRRDQMQRNAEYQELGIEAGLDGTAYQKHLQVRIDPTDAQAINQFRQFNPVNAGIPVPAGSPFEAQEEPRSAGFIADTVQGAEELAGSVARQLRGETLLQTPDGRNAIRRADGTLEEVAPERVMTDQYGNEFYRVDHGDNRIEWVPVNPGSQAGPARPTQGRRGRNRRVNR